MPSLRPAFPPRYLPFTLLALLLASSAFAQETKPNILVIFGDDIGQSNVSAYTMGLMGYRTPNIDRIAREGMIFTDYYSEQSCTAGRSAFITGQATLRTPRGCRVSGRGDRPAPEIRARAG